MSCRALLLFILLALPMSTKAALVINEIAWPYTNFVIVLVVVGLWIQSWRRTKASQNWCLGKMGIGLLILFACVPIVSRAAVVINEIAWMGGAESANDEWIELYNDGGSSVSVDGWLLTDGMNLEIELAGAIGAGQYAVLERTDDASAPGSAFLVYTGALPNTGATLQLQRSDGSLEDQVAGGENWENIGGDNTTKETAQLTSGGWVTGSPTPGRVNVTKGSEPVLESDDEEESVGVTKRSTAPIRPSKEQKTITLELPDHTLALELTAPTLGYVNQPLSFSVEPSGVVTVIKNSLTYDWNFGDITTDSGKDVMHAYQFPGTYVITLRAAFARHEAEIRHEITILPVQFSITRNRTGDIQISNDAPYEIDLSGYVLKGGDNIVIPDRTVLLPNNTITIPHSKLGSDMRSMMVGLYDTASVLVASNLPQTHAVTVTNVVEEAPRVVAAATTRGATTLKPVPAPTITSVAAKTSIEPDSAFSFSSAEQAETVVVTATTSPLMEESAEAGPVMLATAQAAAGGEPPTTPVWSYLALIALLTVSIVGLYVGRPKTTRNQTPSKVVLFDDYD